MEFTPGPRTRDSCARSSRFIQEHSFKKKVPLEDLFKKLKRLNAKDAPSFEDAMLDFGSKCPGSSATTDWPSVMADVRALRTEGLYANPLTDDQAAVLLEWTQQRPTSMYSEITRRTHRRQVESMDPILMLEYALLRALAALPSAGNPVVTRAITRDVASSLPKGKMITWYSPTSTTADSSIAIDFAGADGSPCTFFRIQLTQGLGRDISKYSLFPGEREILLPPGSTFLVKDVLSKNGVSTILLEEVTSQPLIVPMVGQLDACGKDEVFNNQNIIFCGNPGTGKSTQLNGLIGPDEDGLLLFKSGISIGKGLTFDFDSHQGPDNVVYMDTPGLSDISRRREAAQAIVKAFNNGGFYRLFFVITLEAGRFKADDKTTMNLVLEAVPELVEYGIIVNKVSVDVMRVLEDPEVMEEFLDVVFSDVGSRRTNNIFLNGFDDALDDKNNVYKPASDNFKSFIHGIKPIFVKDAAAIDPSDFDEKKHQLSESIAREEKTNQVLSQTKVAAKLAEEHAKKQCAVASAKEAKAKAAEQVAVAAQQQYSKKAALATAEAKEAKQEASKATAKATAEAKEAKQEAAKATANYKIAQKEADEQKDAVTELANVKAKHKKELAKTQTENANQMKKTKEAKNLSELQARLGNWVDTSLRCKTNTQLFWEAFEVAEFGVRPGLALSQGHRATLQCCHPDAGWIIARWDEGGGDSCSGRVARAPASCVVKL